MIKDRKRNVKSCGKCNRLMRNGSRLVCGIMTSVMLFTLCGCGKKAKEKASEVETGGLMNSLEAEQVEGKALDDDFVEASADFSIELFKQSVSEAAANGENVLISPESVLFALGMTANGAAGDTLPAMEEVIAGGMDIGDFNEYMYTCGNRLTDSENVDFHIANSIWIEDGDRISVRDEFLQTDKNYYNADVFLSDFGQNTVDEINGWVDENTNGMITQLLNGIPEDTVMYLINAIAFEGEWESAYEEHQVNENGTFTNYNGIEESVSMLGSTEDVYIQDENAKGFIKYYKGGDFAFMALLPDEDMDVADYIADMSGERFIEMYENRQYCEVIAGIPEFTYEYSTELSEPLGAMGMGKAFSKGADFSAMAETDTGILRISRVLHKTYIQVDRQGTKAAAVTAVEMTCDSAEPVFESPKEVILERPFVYAIIDTETGLPIFIGAVNSAEK